MASRPSSPPFRRPKQSLNNDIERIWAPWRRKFIAHPKPKDCLFCRLAKSKKDAENLLLKRGRKVFSLLNLYPYNNGHLMVAPYRHVGNFEELTSQEVSETFELAQEAIKKLKKLIKPEGFNVGFNIGAVAGAGYDKHIHMHIVPRWGGDTNFMPVVSGDKVISESLESMRRQLASK